MSAPNLNTMLENYPDVPRSVGLKIEFQRIGLAMSKEALDAVRDMDVNFRGEFMFSWDVGERKTLKQRVPWHFRFKRDDTFFLNRTNDNSPYVIDVVNGKFYIRQGEELLEEIYFGQAPLYYALKTSDGVPMSSVVQSLGDLLFITINKFCEYWKDGNECKFCDIVSVTKGQAKKRDLGSAAIRTPAQIAETLAVAWAETKIIHRHAVFSGGTITTTFKGESDLDFYCEVLNKVYRRVRNWYGSAIQIGPPQDKDGWKKLHDTGIPSIQPNIEVWDKRLFEIICSGKDKQVGREEYIRRVIEGVEVFGPGRIIPNFVIGVEMAKPWGFTEIDEAVESTLGGFEYLMQNGVLPRCAIWLRESGSALGGQDAAPFDYYVKLGRGYKALRHKYGFGDNLICLCRACNSQDTIHDWDYVDYLETVNKANAQSVDARSAIAGSGMAELPA